MCQHIIQRVRFFVCGAYIVSEEVFLLFAPESQSAQSLSTCQRPANVILERTAHAKWVNTGDDRAVNVQNLRTRARVHEGSTPRTCVKGSCPDSDLEQSCHSLRAACACSNVPPICAVCSMVYMHSLGGLWLFFSSSYLPISLCSSCSVCVCACRALVCLYKCM